MTTYTAGDLQVIVSDQAYPIWVLVGFKDEGERLRIRHSDLGNLIDILEMARRECRNGLAKVNITEII